MENFETNKEKNDTKNHDIKKNLLGLKNDLVVNEKYINIIKKYPNTSKRFIPALKETGFYPNSKVIEYFLKMGVQESSLSWSPKMDYSKSGVDGRKKQEIKEQLDYAIGTINSFLGKVLIIPFLDNNDEEIISSLISRLNIIYRDKKTTEYDFYIWTNEVSLFFKNLKSKHSTFIDNVPFLGKQIDKIEKKVNHIPSTFGLWQINVDLFLETIKKKGIIEKYPEISNLDDETQRDEMVKALCGKSTILGKDRTMQLIIEGHLKPRYENHNRGESDDLKYMVVENLTGEMSTYYASIQEKLNNEIGSNIKIDGVLTIKKKYSKEIDLKKTKAYGKTYEAFLEYIERKAPGFKENSEVLIKEVYEADSWEKLSKSELYKAIMGNDFGKRTISDDMGSHSQTAEQYFQMVEKNKY